MYRKSGVWFPHHGKAVLGRRMASDWMWPLFPGTDKTILPGWVHGSLAEGWRADGRSNASFKRRELVGWMAEPLAVRPAGSPVGRTAVLRRVSWVATSNLGSWQCDLPFAGMVDGDWWKSSLARLAMAQHTGMYQTVYPFPACLFFSLMRPDQPLPTGKDDLDTTNIL